MKTTFRIAIALAVLLGLVVSNVAWADDADPFGIVLSPDLITSIAVSPDPSTVGGTVSFTVDYNNDLTGAADAALCVYFNPSGDTTSWAANFPATVNTFNATYSLDSDNYCPSITNYDNFYYFVDDTSAISGGDVVEFLDIEVPIISAGTKYIGFRIYSGTDCNDDGDDGGTDAPGGANCGTLGGSRNKSFTVEDAPSTVYASDQSNCGGYGVNGVSCFHELDTAVDNAVNYGASELIIVGNLTVDSTEIASIDNDITTIRGISSGTLVAGNCTDQTLLTINKSYVTTRDLTVDGTTCTDTATGIAFETGITESVVLQNVVVENFSATDAFGVEFIVGTGLVTIKNSTFTDNSYGIYIPDGVEPIVIGGSPSTGNTFTDNTVGIFNDDGNTIIKGNTISGGERGILLQENAYQLYANRIIGANNQQVYCGTGADSGASWNYLGGTSPSSGSNCGDVAKQLGANWISWSDGGVVSGITISGTSSITSTFDLGSNLPFQYGSTANRSSNYFAVWANGGEVVVGGSGTTQYQMFVPPNTGGVCPTGSETTCWESEANGRYQYPPGYFFKGSRDPTAITLRSLTASSARNTWLPAVLLGAALVLGGGGLLLIRRRR